MLQGNCYRHLEFLRDELEYEKNKDYEPPRQTILYEFEALLNGFYQKEGVNLSAVYTHLVH